MKATTDKARSDGVERYTFAHVKEVVPEGGEYDILVVASDATLDRGDEIIDPKGWDLENFWKNPVILAAHMHRLTTGRSPVVGSAPLAEVRGDELVLGIKFAETDLGREYRTLYRDRHMRAVSVGFDPIEGAWQERDAGDGQKGRVWIHTRQELWETSCVAVGANPNALARMRAAAAKPGADPWGLDEKALDALAGALTERISERLLGEGGSRFDRLDERLIEIIACLPDSVGLVQEGAPGPGAPGPGPTRAGGGSDGTDGGGRASAERILAAIRP